MVENNTHNDLFYYDLLKKEYRKDIKESMDNSVDLSKMNSINQTRLKEYKEKHYKNSIKILDDGIDEAIKSNENFLDFVNNKYPKLVEETKRKGIELLIEMIKK